MKTLNLEKYRSEKNTAINIILEVHKTELFGVPPKCSSDGKVYGATPPNLKLLEKLLF